MFHTQFDAFFCDCGRITINPYSVCHIADDGLGKRIIFDRSNNRLPDNAFALITKDLTSANELMYDITDAVKHYGIETVTHCINVIQNLYDENTVHASLISEYDDGTITETKCDVNILHNEIFNIDSAFAHTINCSNQTQKPSDTAKITRRYVKYGNLAAPVVDYNMHCPENTYRLVSPL